MKNRITIGFGLALLTGFNAVQAQDGWTQLDKIYPAASAGSIQFGWAVAAFRDQIVLTNPTAFNNPSGANSVLEVLQRAPTGWERDLTVPSPVGYSTLDLIGFDFAVTRDWIALGTANLNGFVLLLANAGAGNWGSFLRIDSPRPAPSTFGRALALDGDLLVVGDEYAAGTTYARAGCAFVYRLIGGVWTLVDTLTPPPSVVTADGFAFGIKIACSENRIAVAARGIDYQQGAVFVYAPSGPNQWVLEAIPDPAPSDPGDQFGVDLEMEGGVLLAGKIREFGSVRRPGQVFVFERDAADNWPRTAILGASDGSVTQNRSDRFGRAISIDGDCLAVGAMYGRGNGHHDGAAYVFRRDAAGRWPAIEDERFITSDPHPVLSGLGSSIAIGGGIVVVGSAFRNEPFNALYVFGAGEERDLCLPGSGSSATAAHLDSMGPATAAGGELGFVISHAAPGTRYLLYGSYLGDPNGCGRVIGGMDLCLCARPVRVGTGFVPLANGLHFLEPGALTRAGDRLLAIQATVYLQAAALAPGVPVSLTNAIAMRLR